MANKPLPHPAKMLKQLATILLMGCLSACLSPIALDRAVIEYDKSTTDILSKLLLLNIARAQQHQPLHFTGVSNIAATFNFQFNAGATPALTGNTGSLMTPIFGGTLSESPTISIVPIEGEEFTKRLLTPFQESKLTMLLRQGTDVDLILRLLAGELRIYGGVHSGIHLNKPSDNDGYRLFRQAALHLSAIQDRNQLFVEPLMFDQQQVVSAKGVSPEQLVEWEKEFKVSYQADKNQVLLSKRVTGQILITNYDPASLSNAERLRLDEEAAQYADNDVSVDIRPGFPGGEWPIHGVFRLRSFHNVLNFIGLSISDNPEYAVARHPMSPDVSQNPVSTMAIMVSEDEPDNTDISVQFGDRYYALKPETGYQWNREAFRLLCQIFQMTMTDLGQKNAPGITISK